MARLNIDTGTAGNPATGDSIRTAMNKVNNNFEQLFLGLLQSDDNGGFITTNITNGDMRIQPNGAGIIEIDKLKITDDDITSLVTNGNVAITGNGTGGVTVEGIKFVGTELVSDDSTQITIKENLNVTGVITGDGSGITNVGSGSLSASGNDTEVQFNDSGAFAGDSGFTFDGSGGKTLTIGTGGGTVKANSFQGADSVSTGVTFQSDNGSGVKANHLQIQSHTGSVQTVFPSGAVDFTSAGSVDFTGTAVTGIEALTVVGDDSSGTTVSTGETFKFAGATGVTTAVSGDTLTITGTAQDFAFSSITGTPTTIAGYGITDAFDGAFGSLTSTPTTTAGYGITDALALGTTSTTALAGDTTFAFADITSKPTTISGYGITDAFDGAFGSLTSTPTTISGYGITDAASSTATALTVVGDDSSGTGITLGETFKVAGATGVTTAVSGDTLTVTGPDLSSFITATSTDTLTNKTFDVEGTGNSISNIDVADLKSGVLDTDISSVSGSDDTLASAKAIKTYVDSEISGVGGASTGDITFTGSTIQSPSNADITLDPSGTGGVVAQGPVTFNAGYIEKINALTSSSTITVDCATASIHTVTLATSTEFNIANLPTGGTLTLIITQDGAGSRTATFGTDGSSAVKFPSNISTLSTGAADVDVVTIINDGTNFLGNIAKDYRSS